MYVVQTLLSGQCISIFGYNVSFSLPRQVRYISTDIYKLITQLCNYNTHFYYLIITFACLEKANGGPEIYL